MPYISSNIKIEKTKYDRRIKLSEENKKEIVNLYKLPEWSHRKLAKKFNVSKRLIQFILNPEKLKENIERRKERGGWKQYYDKDEWKKTMREHRSYKQKLYLEGKI